MSDTDVLYASSQPYIVDFVFDDAVAEVFPDMIRRSVPGYETIISLIAVIAEKYCKSGVTIYDLGCSLGAVTLAIHSRLEHRDVQYIAVDDSASMIDKCKNNLSHHIPVSRYQCLQADIREVVIKQAGIVVMNFTLQFLPQSDRDAVIRRIYAGLNQGGVLILCEKVLAVDKKQDDRFIELHQQFKVANGYSELEISQKRTALEKVMKLDDADTHMKRLERSGFSDITQWFQCLNFAGWLAIK
jgi:tRNA (cmo5U34)-methyltransferase